MAEEKQLTEKQEAFCQSYLIDFNGAKAARDAGYSVDSAKEEASRLLTNANIRARIQVLRAEMGKAFNISRERIAQEYARIAFSDLRKIFDDDGVLKSPKEWDDDTAAAIAGVDTDELFEWIDKVKIKIGDTKKLKMSDKRAALDSLAKLMGYVAPTRQEITGADGEKFEVSLKLK